MLVLDSLDAGELVPGQLGPRYGFTETTVQPSLQAWGRRFEPGPLCLTHLSDLAR